jgi:uncharacterized membrane protein YjjB (DUF3815 family)
MNVNPIIMLIAGGLGTLGFSLMFRVNPKHMPIATLGGVISCAIYIAFDLLGANLFVSNFAAMLVSGVLCEIFARIFRAPAAIFLLPCVIPLVPGGSLYYTMSYLMSENYETMLTYGKSTLLTALGIAAGMISASVVWTMVTYFMEKKNNNKNGVR